MCGTANPMKAIGPTNAVVLPAKILVASIINIRVFLKFIPKLFAYFSPKSNASQGLITKKLMLNPINVRMDNNPTSFQLKLAKLPKDQKVNFCSCSAVEK